MRPSFPLLKPPLEVSETFGGAKVSDDDQCDALSQVLVQPNTYTLADAFGD